MEEKVDYSGLTDEEFDKILREIVKEMTPEQILSYGDVYNVLAEELNNEVLTRWESRELARQDRCWMAKVCVTLKAGILDPQGKAVKGGLEALGFSEVEDVRVGKYIELRVADGSGENLKARIEEMCQRLLANPVIEDFQFELEEE